MQGALAVGAAAMLAAAWACVPARADVPAQRFAPGRTVIDADESPARAVDPLDGVQRIVPGGGGATLVGSTGTTHTLSTARVDSAGHLARGYGDGGIARSGPEGFRILDAVRRPSGGVFVLGRSPRSNLLTVIALDARGARDRGFAGDGVATPGIYAGCACTNLALRPGGGPLLSGFRLAPGSRIVSLAVVALTPAGAPDSSFGAGGTALLPDTPAYALGAAVASDGGVGVLGRPVDRTYPAFVWRLDALGVPDVHFGDGLPVSLASPLASGIVLHGDGALDVRTGEGTLAALQRVGPGGERGVVTPAATTNNSPRLQSTLAGGVLETDTTRTGPALQLRRVDTSREVSAHDLEPGFGGGDASAAQPLAGNGLRANDLVATPDGGFLAGGSVAISGDGVAAQPWALVRLTSQFTIDGDYGGARRPPDLTLRATRRGSQTRVSYRAGAAGLLELAVAGRRTVVAVTDTAPHTRALDGVGPVTGRLRDALGTTRTVRASRSLGRR